MKKWYEDHGELVAFVRALAMAMERGELDGFSLSHVEIVDVFATPWQWDDEYFAWVTAERPQTFGDTVVVPLHVCGGRREDVSQDHCPACIQRDSRRRYA